MTTTAPRRWPAALLVLLVASSVGIVALSLVPAWLFHDRFMGGHGLTSITVLWNAWQGRAWPFLPIATLLAAAVLLLALLALVRPSSVDRWWLVVPSVLLLALLAASAVPLYRAGYASRVNITPAWALLAAAGLAAICFAAAVITARLGPRGLVITAAALLILGAATYGGRVLALDAAEGNPRHWSEGTYSREATASAPSETLTISGDSYRVDERWSGSIEGRGLVAVLVDDPACPTDRGAYRVFAAGDGAIRFDLIVDLCQDGARADDMTTGIWRRP